MKWLKALAETALCAFFLGALFLAVVSFDSLIN